MCTALSQSNTSFLLFLLSCASFLFLFLFLFFFSPLHKIHNTQVDCKEGSLYAVSIVLFSLHKEMKTFLIRLLFVYSIWKRKKKWWVFAFFFLLFCLLCFALLCYLPRYQKCIFIIPMQFRVKNLLFDGGLLAQSSTKQCSIPFEENTCNISSWHISRKLFFAHRGNVICSKHCACSPKNTRSDEIK